MIDLTEDNRALHSQYLKTKAKIKKAGYVPGAVLTTPYGTRFKLADVVLYMRPPAGKFIIHAAHGAEYAVTLSGFRRLKSGKWGKRKIFINGNTKVIEEARIEPGEDHE